MATRHYSENEIIRQVTRLYAKRRPLNITAVQRSHPKLLESAFAKKTRKPFLGWKRALEKAGIDYQKINTELSEFVVCEICGAEVKMIHNHALYAHGVSIEEYREEFPGAEEISDRSRAIKCRGFSHQKILPHWEPFWTPEYILDRAYALFESGYPIHIASIEELDGAMANAIADSQETLGSWNDILERIGLDPDSIRRRNFSLNSPEEVVDAIQTREAEGRPLNSTSVYNGEHANGALMNAAQKFFGDWESALSAAGFDPVLCRLKKNIYDSPEKVIETLQDRQARGLPLNHGTINQEECDLEGKMYQYFGSWDDALLAAGIDPNSVSLQRRRYHGEDDVIEAIHDRAENGLPLKAKSLVSGDHADWTLRLHAIRYFGSWYDALAAAGFDETEIREIRNIRFPHKESVIEHIQKLDREGHPLYHSAIRPDSAFRKATREYFGTYERALSASGISPDRAKTPGIRRKYPDHDSVIGEIQKRLRQKKSLNTTKIQKGPESDLALSASGRELFGSWDAALAAAGIDPESTAPVRPVKYSTTEEVRAEILARKKRGNSLNTTRVQKGKESDATLFRSARRYFGSWDAALEAAGIDPATTGHPTRRKYPDAESVAMEIKSRVKRSLPINHAAVAKGKSHADSALVMAAKRYLGNWDNALKLAGIDPAEVRKR